MENLPEREEYVPEGECIPKEETIPRPTDELDANVLSDKHLRRVNKVDVRDEPDSSKRPK